MEKIQFSVNGHPVTFHTDTVTVDLLRDDDEFVYQYVSHAVRAGNVKGLQKDIEDITIERICDNVCDLTDEQGEGTYSEGGVDTYKNEELISLVQTRPPLYNFRLPIAERTKPIKERLWREIIDIMQVDTTVEEVAKKWKSLRDYYMKIRGEIKKKPPSGSGQSDTTDSKKIWKFYDLMAFLDDTLESRQTTSNIKPSTHASGSSSSSISSDNCNLSKASFNIKKRKSMESSVLDKIEQIAKAPILIESNTNKSIFDGTEHFCIHLSEGLKKLPYRARSELEIEMMKKLHEYMVLYDIE